MNISEEEFREAVLRAIRQIEAEFLMGQDRIPSKRVYMICLREWDERYPAFLKKAASDSQMEICPIIPPEWRTNGCEALLRGSGLCKALMTYEEASGINICEDDTTVFPVVPRELVAKTALGISDTFETQWIVSSMEQGSRILFLNSGLRRFTGKEPECYTARILSYYRIVLEYGIEITDELVPEDGDRQRKQQTVSTGSMNKGDNVNRVNNVSKVNSVSKVNGQKKRKIITSGNLEDYQEHGVIILNPGDQITDVAKDRAKFLKIALKKAETSC